MFGKREAPFLSATAQVKADTFTKNDDHRLVVASHPEWLEQGARTFLEKHSAGQVAYFDELEALFLIGQTSDERVEAKVLVKADERFPGGHEITSVILHAASVAAQEQHVLFLLCMGDAKQEVALKELRHKLRERAERKTLLNMSAGMTPGQGMAVVTVTAAEWRESVTLDFLQMTDSQHTISSLERDMPRSFRISNYENNVARDFYLLYNLLQFHTSILSNLKKNKMDACWLIVQHIPYWYKRFAHDKGGRMRHVTIGYILKSLLYFLRCRLYNGKKFLTPEHDTKHYQIISDCL